MFVLWTPLIGDGGGETLGKSYCYGVNVCASPKFLFWRLILNMMPLGGEDLGRQLVNEGGDFINGIHVLIRR